MEKYISSAAEFVVPVERVELSIKGGGGRPIAVLCEPIELDAFVKITRRLPGIDPATGKRKENIEDLTDDEVKQYAGLAAPILEAGVAIMGPGGELVRPGISSTEPCPEHAIPFRYLPAVDKVRLMSTILRLSGFTKENAERNSFRRMDGGGVEAGDEPVAVIESLGEEALGGDADPGDTAGEAVVRRDGDVDSEGGS